MTRADIANCEPQTMSDLLTTTKPAPVIEICNNRAYLEGVLATCDALCAEWGVSREDLEIWFGNSPDGTGEHPNYQIEVTGQPDLIRKFYWSGKANDRLPERYKRSYLRGPYACAWVSARIKTIPA